jgi:hypothetical protein
MGLVAASRFCEANPGVLPARTPAQGNITRASASTAGLEMLNIALFLFQRRSETPNPEATSSESLAPQIRAAPSDSCYTNFRFTGDNQQEYLVKVMASELNL